MASLNPYAPLFVPAAEAPLSTAPSISTFSCAYGYPYYSDAIPQPVCPFPCGLHSAEALHVPGLGPARLHQLPPYSDYYFYYHHGIGMHSGVTFPWSTHAFIRVDVPFLAPPEITLPSYPAFPLQREGLLAPPPAWCPPFHPMQPEILEVQPTPLLGSPMPCANPRQRSVVLRKRGVKICPRWRVKADSKNGSLQDAGRTADGLTGRGRRGPNRGLLCRGLRNLWIPKFRCYRRRSPDEANLYEHFRFKTVGVLEESSGTPAGVDSGDDRTTVMIKNIPNKLRKETLLNILDVHCFHENGKVAVCGLQENQLSVPSQFDFFYLPIDFGTGCNLGYAFVNFTSAAAARRLHLALNQASWISYGSKKVCEVTYARIQGLPGLLKHFRGATFPRDCPDVLPLHFVPHRDGICQGRYHYVGRPIPHLSSS